MQFWLQQFKTNTAYEQTEYITYPEESEYGRNILAGGSFKAFSSYSFAAHTPAWSSLKVEVRGKSEWSYEVMPNAPRNWQVGIFTRVADEYNTQMFTVINPGEDSLLKFHVENGDDLEIVFYENSETPTRKIEINVLSDGSEPYQPNDSVRAR